MLPDALADVSNKNREIAPLSSARSSKLPCKACSTLISLSIFGVFLWEDPDQDFWSVAFLWTNPFSDQWAIESTLDKDSSDHWSEQSENGSSDWWSTAFLWIKNPKFIQCAAVFAVNGAFPARRYSTFVVSRHQKYRNLALFLPAPIYIRHKMDELQIVEVACTKTVGFTTKLP